jgi:DNA primase
MAALLDALGQAQANGQDDGQDDQADDSGGAASPGSLGPLLARLAGFHAVDDEEDPALLVEAVLRRLRQIAVKDELDWLIESGELSEAAITRRNELFVLTAELKNAAAAPSGRN